MHWPFLKQSSVSFLLVVSLKIFRILARTFLLQAALLTLLLILYQQLLVSNQKYLEIIGTK